MRKLYVVTKPLFDANRVLKTHLVGVLTELSLENYSFKYLLGGEFHKNSLKIPQFQDINRIYEGKSVEAFTTLYAPKPNDRYYPIAMFGAKLKAHDEWAMLIHFGKIEGTKEFYLLQDIPMEAVFYE